jgi:hypothetical protein
MRKTLLSALMACSLMSARAAVFQYSLNFSDVGEANPSPNATGSGFVNYDNVAHTLQMSVTFGGLQGTTSAAHIHAPTVNPFTGSAGVATTLPSFAGFPLGVTSGTFANTLDLTLSSSWNPSFVTANGGTTAGAEAAFATAIAGGRGYFNIHSSFGSGGEIRAFLVPEPSTIALGIVGGVMAAGLMWRRNRKRS